MNSKAQNLTVTLTLAEFQSHAISKRAQRFLLCTQNNLDEMLIQNKSIRILLLISREPVFHLNGLLDIEFQNINI